MQAAASTRKSAGVERGAPRVEIRVAREAHVERLESLRGLQEHPGCLAAGLLAVCEVGPKSLESSAPHLVEWSRLRGREEPLHYVERPGTQTGPRCGERSSGSPSGIAGQCDRSLEQCRRCREASARMRPTG